MDARPANDPKQPAPARQTQSVAKPAPPGQQPPALSTVSLKDLGPNLPCGILAGSGRERLFRLRPFRLKEEKRLAEFREGSRGKHFGSFITNVLSTMVQSIGSMAFDGKTDDERSLFLATRLLMADALYMYLYLRWETMGDEPVWMTVTCPNCRSSYQFAADLGSLEVRVYSGDQLDLRRRYMLNTPLIVRGHEIKTLWLEPLKWSAAEAPGFLAAGAKEAMVIQSSIVGADEADVYPFPIADAELDELTKFDFEGIQYDIQEHAPGPVMTVETECPKCRLQFTRMMDWGYDSFFSRSSPANRGKRS